MMWKCAARGLEKLENNERVKSSGVGEERERWETLSSSRPTLELNASSKYNCQNQTVPRTFLKVEVKFTRLAVMVQSYLCQRDVGPLT